MPQISRQQRWRSRRTFQQVVAHCLGLAAVLCCAAMLALTSTISTAVRLLTNALVMDGTTFATPSPGFVAAAINDFIVPTLGGSYTGIAVTTPEQIVGINQSVQDGLADLQAAMAEQQQTDPGQPYVVFGYSQSSVIENLEKAELEQQKAGGQPVPDVTFVEIGDGNRPNGGIAERFPGLVIPFFDFTFNGAAPTDNGIPTIDIARQYDGLADTPEYPIDLAADANAVLGVIFVHALYGEEVSLDPSSPNYVPGTIEQQYGDTSYYFIPTADLPLLDPLRLFGVPESVIDIIQPFFKVLVEAGYDRSDPFGQPTPAQLIPVIDPVTFTLALAGAVLEGANNAAAPVGAQLPGYATLAGLLAAAQSWSAAAIGVPYGQVVSAINNVFNPFLIFDQLEGPVAASFNSVVNGLGVPRIVNAVIDATLFPVTAWFERNILFPQAATTSGASNTNAVQQNPAAVAPQAAKTSITDPVHFTVRAHDDPKAPDAPPIAMNQSASPRGPAIAVRNPIHSAHLANTLLGNHSAATALVASSGRPSAVVSTSKKK